MHTYGVQVAKAENVRKEMTLAVAAAETALRKVRPQSKLNFFSQFM